MKRLAFYIFVIFSIVVFDQWTKYYVSTNFNLYETVRVIDGFLNFTFAKNSGAAFSFGTGYEDWVRVLLFKVLPVFACFWLGKLLVESLNGKKALSWAYALILGGAIGNLIDRIRLDYVVDFIAVYQNEWNILGMKIPSWHFAIFNIADSAVSIAAFIIIVDYLFFTPKVQPEAKMV